MATKEYEVVLLKDMTDRLGRKYSRNDIFFQTDGKKFYGEMGNPNELNVSLDKVSHYIDNIRIVENDLVGTLHIMNTPNGVIFEAIAPFMPWQTSMRATGYLAEDNTVTEVIIYAFDVVPKKD